MRGYMVQYALCIQGNNVRGFRGLELSRLRKMDMPIIHNLVNIDQAVKFRAINVPVHFNTSVAIQSRLDF